MVVYEKGGNKVREQPFKFRSSTFIYAWNYSPIRFIFFFFISLLKDPSFTIFFFYFSRNSWSFSFSSILINFSSKIFITIPIIQIFYANIFKLVNIFRTNMLNLFFSSLWYIFLYIFVWITCIDRNLFLKLILYFHMAHIISGENVTSLYCSKNKVGRNIYVSSGDQKIVFFHCPSLFDHLFSFFEKIFSYLWKKIYSQNFYIS